MQFDSIGRDSRLTMEEIKHAYTHDLYGDAYRLKSGSDVELSVELGARVLNAGKKRAACAYAGGQGDLRDHGVADTVLDH